MCFLFPSGLWGRWECGGTAAVGASGRAGGGRRQAAASCGGQWRAVVASGDSGGRRVAGGEFVLGLWGVFSFMIFPVSIQNARPKMDQALP